MVTNVINDSLGDNAICIASDDNAAELIIRIRLMNDDNKDNLELLKAVMNDLLHNLLLKGMASVTRVLMRQQDDEWVLETDGSNLQHIMAMPGVDFTRTTSNHILEVLQCLGLEAARHTLLSEMRKVIEFDGSYVNYRHLSILCDSMTRNGHVMPITRHGINRVEASPLACASFEETVDIFFRYAHTFTCCCLLAEALTNSTLSLDQLTLMLNS